MDVQNAILWRKFFSGFAYTAMQSVFFIYLQVHKGFDTQLIASAFSVLLFTSQSFSLFAGSWGDRFGRSRIMMLGCMMDVAAYLLLIWTDNAPMLFLSTALFGLGSTLFSTNARAFLLSNAANNYAAKTHAQGKFLKISSLSAMAAPLFALPFICFKQPEWLIWASAAIEMTMLVFMLLTMPRTQCAFTFEPFRFNQVSSVVNKPFIYVHLLLFIPLGFASAFYVIFPYIFTQLLDYQALVPIAFFLNNLLGVLLQGQFSRKINLGTGALSTLAPIVVLVLIFATIGVQHQTSLLAALGYLLLFSLISLFANTAMANYLVHLDTGKNQGVLFGMSKLLLSMTTLIVMNALPYLVLR